PPGAGRRTAGGPGRAAGRAARRDRPGHVIRTPPRAVHLRARVQAFLALLVGLLFIYTTIILLGEQPGAATTKVAVLGALLVGAAWTRRSNNRRLVVVAAAGGIIALAVLLVSVAGSSRVAFGVSGAAVVVLCVAMIWMIVSILVAVHRVDVSTVLGVLCTYLLIALIFAALGQVAASFQYGQDEYVRGVDGPPSASDLLYLSVITLCTVGYGDITPVSGLARALVVMESLIGQLYLVSIVAAVIGGWRVGDAARAERAKRIDHAAREPGPTPRRRRPLRRSGPRRASPDRRA
ncbi:potassium channel family protein, partial [Luedemannella flava]|uniref:potassium channel family protein n=1 Tax=Luedemannella flava TaxID=349316 RepID=UPI0031DE7B6E